MASESSKAHSELHEFAAGKIGRVLGPDRAHQLLQRFAAEMGTEVHTPQDLLVLSEKMAKLGGLEAAVAAMLGVAAVLRGAAPADDRSP